MRATSATTIAEVTALGPVNGLRGLATFRPDPSYGALSSFRPEPSYGAMSGAPYSMRNQNKFPYGMGGLGVYDGTSIAPVIIGVGAVALGVGLFVWFWSAVFRLAKDKL